VYPCFYFTYPPANIKQLNTDGKRLMAATTFSYSNSPIKAITAHLKGKTYNIKGKG